MVKERRQAPRIPSNYSIRIHDDRNFRDEKIQDLSAGGIFIRTKTPNQVGETLRLTLLGGTAEEQIHVQAIVVWSKIGKRPSESGMGVQFFELEGEERQKLHDFLDRQFQATRIFHKKPKPD